MEKIIEAEDMLFAARNCVECIYMAASGFGDGLKNEATDPIQTIADIASKKIDEAIALLVKCRGSVDARVPAPADAKPVSPDQNIEDGARPKVQPVARTKRSGK